MSNLIVNLIFMDIRIVDFYNNDLTPCSTSFLNMNIFLRNEIQTDVFHRSNIHRITVRASDTTTLVTVTQNRTGIPRP